MHIFEAKWSLLSVKWFHTEPCCWGSWQRNSVGVQKSCQSVENIQFYLFGRKIECGHIAWGYPSFNTPQFWLYRVMCLDQSHAQWIIHT